MRRKNNSVKKDGHGSKSLAADASRFVLARGSQEPAPPDQPPAEGPPLDGYVTVLPIATNNAPEGATGVDFVFLYSPTILGGKYIGECSRPHDVVLSCRWKGGEELPKTLVVRHEDGQPELKQITWTTNGEPVKDWPELPTRARRYPERHRLIKDMKDDVLRERAEAMCSFDERTDPYQLSLAKDPLEGDIVQLTRALSLRTLQRASWAAQNREFEPMASEDAALAARATRVEEFVRGLLLEINPGPKPPQLRGEYGRSRPSSQPSLFLRQCEETIAAFVAGELHMSKLFPDGPAPMAMDGIPDGPNLFAFAEAALLFIRLDLQRRFWERLLPVFVCAAEFFAVGYWNEKRRRLDAYHPSHVKPVASEMIRRHLQQRYRGLTPSQLAAQFSFIVGQALREDPAISHPTRTAKEFTCL